ncbi:Uncharacterised protein [Mycoplasmopsis arginini]|uniref:Uncharacterized protein n=1 Tax=Rickettsia bellii str. RML Mogi TaxID=1359194 RepID=A0A0F3QEU0_RICBE|nr:hypothetical protein [Rickettsia bellii]SGA03271.1 Uncharacterised protein [Chlamydia abortus]SGA15484.1 Uncharacterised protein [Mycoplasmopsis arginini]KJV91080.1 hypothetical protein RBEMOGI_1674 [Rickettsia bellii str. RML Mogi]SGA28803.1 Uncharacterised protein [Mycoplasmopsis arginini]SGA33389.1 Uncharacterised protein [Chlamydia abortus]
MIFRNKNLSSVLPEDIYSFKPQNTGLPSSINLDEFVDNNPDSAFMQGLNEASNKMNELFNY